MGYIASTLSELLTMRDFTRCIKRAEQNKGSKFGLHMIEKAKEHRTLLATLIPARELVLIDAKIIMAEKLFEED